MHTMFRATCALGAIVAATWGHPSASRGAIHVVDLGTASPPIVVGGYSMTPFGIDPRNAFAPATGISGAQGAPFGALTFSHTVYAATEGQWGTWSHGYLNSIYFNDTSGIFGTPQSGTLSITLPANTGAFSFYGEPLQFGAFSMTATANDGTSLAFSVVGNAGARGWAFYVNSVPGPALTTITITSADTHGYAVGEFGVAAQIPAPGAAMVAMLGIGALARHRRRT